MAVDTTRNYSLATDDEEYSDTFPNDFDDDGEDWWDEEEDYYDFPETDRGDEGFFDPEEK